MRRCGKNAAHCCNHQRNVPGVVRQVGVVKKRCDRRAFWCVFWGWKFTQWSRVYTPSEGRWKREGRWNQQKAIWADQNWSKPIRTHQRRPGQSLLSQMGEWKRHTEIWQNNVIVPNSVQKWCPGRMMVRVAKFSMRRANISRPVFPSCEWKPLEAIECSQIESIVYRPFGELKEWKQVDLTVKLTSRSVSWFRWEEEREMMVSSFDRNNWCLYKFTNSRMQERKSDQVNTIHWIVFSE